MRLIPNWVARFGNILFSWVNFSVFRNIKISFVIIKEALKTRIGLCGECGHDRLLLVTFSKSDAFLSQKHVVYPLIDERGREGSLDPDYVSLFP